MNKKIYLVIINFIIFIFYTCISYGSTSGIVYLESNNKFIEKDKEVEITVYIKDVKTVAYNLYLYFDSSKLEYVSGPENTNVIENCVISVWHDKEGGSLAKSEELGKFVFKAKEDGIALFNIEGEFYNINEELIEIEFEEIQIEIGEVQNTNFKEDAYEENSDIDVGKENFYSDLRTTNQENNLIGEFEGTSNVSDVENSNLEVLALENTLLYPPFEANITEYNAEISEQSNILNIFAVPENENASLEILGNHDLKEGNNLIKAIVTAQDGITKKEYKINVYKRNNDEEIEYQEEQEINKQKLEEIYKAEKVNLQVENFEDKDLIDVKNKESKEFNLIFLLLIILSVVIAGISIYKTKKKYRK